MLNIGKTIADLYYIKFDDFVLDIIVAKFIYLSLDEYQDILKKHNGVYSFGDVVFNSYEDAKSALEELELIYILNKLIQ